MRERYSGEIFDQEPLKLDFSVFHLGLKNSYRAYKTDAKIYKYLPRTKYTCGSPKIYLEMFKTMGLPKEIMWLPNVIFPKLLYFARSFSVMYHIIILSSKLKIDPKNAQNGFVVMQEQVRISGSNRKIEHTWILVFMSAFLAIFTQKWYSNRKISLESEQNMTEYPTTTHLKANELRK